MAAAVVLGLAGCGQTPQYDTSSPQATLDAMRRMVADGHPELLGSVIHIQARDITFDDGVTEASAIQDVIHKASAMLGLYALGAGVPMLLIAYGGRWVNSRLSFLQRHADLLRKLFGLMAVGVAVLQLLQYDVLVSAWATQWLPPLSQGL